MKDKAYEIARNHGYDGYQGALASVVFKFFLIRKYDQEWVEMNNQLKNYMNQ